MWMKRSLIFGRPISDRTRSRIGATDPLKSLQSNTHSQMQIRADQHLVPHRSEKRTIVPTFARGIETRRFIAELRLSAKIMIAPSRRCYAVQAALTPKSPEGNWLPGPALGKHWTKKKLKAIRYQIINLPGRVVNHARELWVKIGGVAAPGTLRVRLCEIRKRILALAYK
jgi:hypothetical protein